jgi:NAD(P)-dependent dehydrogenase (short-subunit alcohol dehydrogenase family)
LKIEDPTTDDTVDALSYEARQIFSRDLLRGRSIALSGATAPPIRELLQSLGAWVSDLDPVAAADEEHAAALSQTQGRLDALVCSPDSSGQAAEAEIQHTLSALDNAWAAVSAAANASFIPTRQGRIVLLAPRPGDLRHAELARAALENLARTLSVEWARFGITTVAVVPGAISSDDELAQLVAFLCSPAGAYYSGCRVDLGVVEPQHPKRMGA